MIAIGTDIVEIDRITATYQRLGQAFVQRILTSSEIKQFESRQGSVAFLAKRFAAKEAVAKALGTGIGRGVSWQHIEISNHPDTGAPDCQLSDGALQVLQRLGGRRVLLSLSDEKHYAVAYAAII